jgi:hypothetical protein
MDLLFLDDMPECIAVSVRPCAKPNTVDNSFRPGQESNCFGVQQIDYSFTAQRGLVILRSRPVSSLSVSLPHCLHVDTAFMKHFRYCLWSSQLLRVEVDKLPWKEASLVINRPLDPTVLLNTGHSLWSNGEGRS